MTAEELFALPDNDRIDRRLIRGRLIERPYPFRCPGHAGVIASLSTVLGNWERSAVGVGWSAFGYGCPYRLRRDPDTVLYFDASIVSAALDEATPAHASFINGLPTLAVEVIDLSDPADAIGELVDVAITAGVPMVWLIDPFAETVTVHRPNMRSTVLKLGDVLEAESVLPGLRCRVAEIIE